MANVQITDQLSLTASLEVSDKAPLSLANLRQLNFHNLPIIGDFGKPIDQFPIEDAKLGLAMTVPGSVFSSDAAAFIGGGISASLSIFNHQRGKLFADEFSPSIGINAGECWAGLSIDFSLKESVAFSSGGISIAMPPIGFGITLSVSQSVSLGTYLHFPIAGSQLPTLQNGLATLLGTYSVPLTPQSLRDLPLDVVHTAEASGAINLGVCYAAPLIVNPLATLNHPLNLALNVQPNIAAIVSGSIEVSGTFAIRAYRSTATKLVLGAYKKRETCLSASLSAGAGVGIDNAKGKDLLAKVLDAVVPAADLTNLRLDDKQRDELRKALKECVDQSIALALNATCSASISDEAALIYEIDLAVSDFTLTDQAITSALHGDWSLLATLPNARPLRNIVRELHQRKHKLNINLLGLYNATSIADYMESATVLHDEHGQISMVDQAAMKSLAAGTTPYAAKSDKLRSALAEAFIATVSYGVSKGKLGITSFTVQQSFLEYHAKATSAHLTPEIFLARGVGLPLAPAWDSILKYKGAFSQNKFYLSIAYDLRSALNLFYQDVENRLPYSAEKLDRIGRDVRLRLLDPLAPNSMQRRAALTDDSLWNAMSANGNTATFSLIPGLAKLSPTALAAIAADFLDIRWWSQALQKVTPKLTALLQAIEAARPPNPLADPAFTEAHRALNDALAGLTSQTHSAFGDGWSLAVMQNLASSSGAGAAPSVQMDIGWDGKFEHYETGVEIAVGQTSGT